MSRRPITFAPCGSWRSPITPETFSQGNCGRLTELQVYKDSVFWTETNIATGRRELYESRQGKDDIRIVWADGHKVQNAVHEYGGGSFIILPLSGRLLFTTTEGIFIQPAADLPPAKVVNGDAKLRFADPGSSPDESFFVVVEEIHPVPEEGKEAHGDPVNRIAAYDTATGVRKATVATGCDFYAQPRVSPCGKFVSWMQWNHNNMPWDETEVCVKRADLALLDELRSAESGPFVLHLSGVGRDISYVCPSWYMSPKTKTTKFLVLSDETDFWNVYEYQIYNNDKPVNLLPINKDLGFPMWQFGIRDFGRRGAYSIYNASGTLYYEKDGEKEGLIREIDTPDWNTFAYVDVTEGGVAYCIAQGPRRAPTLLRIDLNKKSHPVITKVRETMPSNYVESLPISKPRVIEFESNGQTLWGYFYLPRNDDYVARAGSRPPLIVMGHSGPTLPTSCALDLRKQFFTSRGFAIFDVNYRGSSGCGRKFRNMLYGQWGIADRDDLIAGAKKLASEVLIDNKRVCLMGSSSSGFTLLACILEAPSVFAAAVSSYGVADLLGLSKDSHKFEKGYNEALLGRLPEAEEEYRQRSPITHIQNLSVPIAFFHGTEDTVVPVQQSIDMFNALRDRGVTTGLMLFEGEGHGFRGAAAVKESTEAAYYFLCKATGIIPSVDSKLDIHNLREMSTDGEEELPEIFPEPETAPAIHHDQDPPSGGAADS